MIDRSAPPTGPVDISSCPMWRLAIVLCILGASFVYAVAILIVQWTPPVDSPSPLNGKVPLEALLFEQGAQLDLYSVETRQGIVRRANVLQAGSEHHSSPRLLSTRAILVDTGSGARVRDISSNYEYNPLPEEPSSLRLLNRNTRAIFSVDHTAENPHVTYSVSDCGTIAEIPLPKPKTWYAPQRLFPTLGIPEQRKMILSPAETSLVILDHSADPRLALVNLVDRTMQELSAPGFDAGQIHFSPFYIDEETLLFSVLDRNHWGTMRYHIPTGTYEMLSPNFTDHAYHSLSGEIILQQSFYDETINVPFGSVALFDQKRGVPVQMIESLIGPKENHAELFSLLFQQPEKSSLHFKTDLTTQSFNAIAESDLREPLRTFWRDYQLKLSHAVGVFHLLKLNPDDSLTTIETIPFEIRPPATSPSYGENAEPLLRALELPLSLIEEYRKRSTDATSGGDFYTLVDDLSY